MVPIKVIKLNGQQIFIELPNIKYHENPLVVLKLLHTGKWTDGHTDSEAGRQAGRQTDRQTDRAKLIAKYLKLFVVKTQKCGCLVCKGN